MYELISSSLFENVIMFFIALNTLGLAMNIFPTQARSLEFAEAWKLGLTIAEYILVGVFTAELIVKVFALRGAYLRDQ